MRRGARVLGLCGGYQMLGQEIADPEGIEGKPGSSGEGVTLSWHPRDGTAQQPITGQWKLSRDTSVNYMVVARRPAA